MKFFSKKKELSQPLLRLQNIEKAIAWNMFNGSKSHLADEYSNPINLCLSGIWLLFDSKHSMHYACISKNPKPQVYHIVCPKYDWPFNSLYSLDQFSLLHNFWASSISMSVLTSDDPDKNQPSDWYNRYNQASPQ